jgi:hypothetical protein
MILFILICALFIALGLLARKYEWAKWALLAYVALLAIGILIGIYFGISNTLKDLF